METSLKLPPRARLGNREETKLPTDHYTTRRPLPLLPQGGFMGVLWTLVLLWMRLMAFNETFNDVLMPGHLSVRHFGKELLCKTHDCLAAPERGLTPGSLDRQALPWRSRVVQ
ncbi:hypothetical protein E2C01_065646 [Portunus trituberculatus]|uniref:Uncharacterized protein n=1 Tax=Portunus trituberculatus TaxID=210409 RepID=A0A5B7HNT9_PORTR|nr:hypothetical protein [Portunus trituberculatus]